MKAPTVPTFLDYFSFVASHTRPVSGVAGTVVAGTNGAAVESCFIAPASSARMKGGPSCACTCGVHLAAPALPRSHN